MSLSLIVFNQICESRQIYSHANVRGIEWSFVSEFVKAGGVGWIEIV